MNNRFKGRYSLYSMYPSVSFKRCEMNNVKSVKSQYQNKQWPKERAKFASHSFLFIVSIISALI